jgi:hypothetical protein
MTGMECGHDQLKKKVMATRFSVPLEQHFAQNQTKLN